MRAGAFDGLEAGGDDLATSPSTYLAGLVYEAGGIVAHNVLNLPENAFKIVDHGIGMSGLRGARTESEARLVNAMIKGESAVFFGEVIPAMFGNIGETTYSIVSGDPMPFNVSTVITTEGISFSGSYSSESQFLTDSATGLLIGTYTASNLGYQGVNGKLTPGSFILPVATGASVAATLIDKNKGFLKHIENQYGISGGIGVLPDGRIVFANGTWQKLSVDPVAGNNPKESD